MEFLEKKSPLLMKIALTNHSIILAIFTILFLILKTGEFDVYYQIYVCSILFLFLIYMLYFAHHSTSRAYKTELFIFLLIATIGTITLIYNIFIMITTLNKDNNIILSIFGYISITFLVAGNILYFISSYFFYYNFELKIMDKIGAQPKYINMYSWIQFQISCVKCDLGLIVFFAISFTLGVNKEEKLDWVYFLLDSLMVLFSIGITLGLNYNVRREVKSKVILFSILRILIQGYLLFRFPKFFDDLHILSEDKNRNVVIMVSITGTVVDILLFLMIVISTIKCYTNFDKGLKNIIFRKKIKLDEINKDTIDYKVNFNQSEL